MPIVALTITDCPLVWPARLMQIVEQESGAEAMMHPLWTVTQYSESSGNFIGKCLCGLESTRGNFSSPNHRRSSRLGRG